MDLFVPLGSAAGMALTILLISFLNKATITPTDQKVYRMAKAYLFMGYLMMGIALAILIVPQLLPNAPSYYHPAAWAFIILLFLAGVYIRQVYVNHHVTVDGETFVVHSAFKRQKTFRFEDIRGVSFNLFTSFINIKDQNGQRGSVYIHLIGIRHWLQAIREKSGTDTSSVDRALKI